MPERRAHSQAAGHAPARRAPVQAAAQPRVSRAPERAEAAETRRAGRDGDRRRDQDNGQRDRHRGPPQRAQAQQAPPDPLHLMAQIDQGATTRRAHSRDAGTALARHAHVQAAAHPHASWDAGTAPARRVQVQAAAHPHDHGARRHAREDGHRDRRAAAGHSDRAQGRGQRDGQPAHIGAPQVAEGEQGVGLEVLTALAELLRACRRYMGIACTHLDSLAQSLSATGCIRADVHTLGATIRQPRWPGQRATLAP
eukprot:682408-Amphidinium_carterae.1